MYFIVIVIVIVIVIIIVMVIVMYCVVLYWCNVGMYVCTYVCMYVRTYVCMYVRMYVCMWIQSIWSFLPVPTATTLHHDIAPFLARKAVELSPGGNSDVDLGRIQSSMACLKCWKPKAHQKPMVWNRPLNGLSR